MSLVLGSRDILHDWWPVFSALNPRFTLALVDGSGCLSYSYAFGPGPIFQNCRHVHRGVFSAGDNGLPARSREFRPRRGQAEAATDLFLTVLVF